ncbi:hypothetical protein LBMAG33_4320 [Candidatus Levyibacteriota bacterium]|nr:hypothetical protein LBMAG33_4320 [Candidatus Levybacteria bacterium]
MKRMFSYISKNKGFTLIELLIVVSIIGILSSLLLSNFISVRQRTRDGVRKNALGSIQTALEIYRSDNGSYPSLLANCPTLGDKVKFMDTSCDTSTYMEIVPKDPLGGNHPDYSYTSSLDRTTYTLIACLENSKDADKDPSPTPSICPNDNTFTKKNP